MTRFKYDTEKLIEAVRDRPCLWDKRTENYKDRIERKQAWIEIFIILDERYEAMSSEEKRLTSEIVLSKWANIRDAFTKSLKKVVGRPRKKYLLYNHLKFLLPLIPDAEDQDHLDTSNSSFTYVHHQQYLTKDEQKDTSYYDETAENVDITYDDTNEPETETSETETAPVAESSSKRKRFKKESSRQGDTNMEFVSVDDPRIMNEDEAFFASLLPTVVKYDEDERLEFRIEVLALMKRIKDKRRFS